jgi:TRAP-type C4-dicarboxylate transport system permease small subunit
MLSSRVRKNAHLRRCAHPSSLRRISMYASFLRISRALHLNIFAHPVDNGFFSNLLGKTDSVEELSRRINRIMEYGLFGMGLSMTLIVAAQVFSRYVLNRSLFWSEELARFLLVWLTFLGASVAYYRGVNPGVDVLYTRFSDRGKRAAMTVVHCLSLSLFAVMIVYGTQFAHFVRLQITPALGLPKWIPHSIIPISGAIMWLHGLTFLLREIRGKRHDR